MFKGKIAEIINNVYDAVEESKVGKIQGNENGKKVINSLPLQTFLTILNSSFPKNVEGEIGVKEPKEPWQS